MMAVAEALPVPAEEAAVTTAVVVSDLLCGIWFAVVGQLCSLKPLG
jgi:hypothetical protein